MTSPRQQTANRLNALSSSGPKTDAGKRRSSVNSKKHGLTIPIECSPWATQLEIIQAALAEDGLGEDECRVLGLFILDYERNLEHQRQLFLRNRAQGSSLDISETVNEADFKHLLADPSIEQWEKEYPSVRKKMDRARSRYLSHLMAQKGRQLRRKQLVATRELQSANRHLRRSSNQLIRHCRRLGSARH